MHKSHLRNAVLLASLAMALAACGKDGGTAQMAGGGQMPPPEVGVVTLAEQVVPIISELPGRTSPFRIAEVRPQVNGIVLKRLYTEGSDVKAGQQLYQIDPATYQAALESAQASFAKAQANVTSAKLKEERYKALLDIKGVSKQEYDDANAALLQGQADVASAKAAVESARINLTYTRVLSPISGRIGKSTVTEGALVTANQAAALTTVQQLDPIYVDIAQSSTDLLRLKRDFESGRLSRAGQGQAKVNIVLEDGSKYAQPGALQFADVTVDPTSGAVNLRAVVPNPKGELLPGVFVRARLEEGVNNKALLVPQQGVTRDAQGNAVAMVIGAEGKVEVRILKAQQSLGDKWLVSDGLKAGDKVIVEGLQKVRPGSPAKPVEASAVVAAAALKAESASHAK
ncbi:efflux RND transporter periplasmic adaptor subunit [Andreprevotia chitinilytica]|uniref:efflux RND transporter periplasmic adaptor subunit n=1 Tax=Andreprevotia chitinilytica TaxID=396808 RepID=UPI000552E8E9|nr:efflux RND transporter periplasmic adaptor subunit [Andreprevotia chitinilytica]